MNKFIKVRNVIKILPFLLLLIFPVLFSAAKDYEVKYESDVILDSDLDGLTDEGEKQIFLTDPENPDTDADGTLDGAEIISQTNPLDPNEPKAKEVAVPKEKKEIPWAWYATRAAALMGFLLLYFSFLFGLAIRTPGLRKIIPPADSFSIHGWISLQALIFAAIHGIALLFDNFLSFSIGDVFLPFVFNPSQVLLAIGISKELVLFGTISFYIMLILVITSYLRKFIGQKIWRALHFLNISLYVFVVIHALYLGTDLKLGALRYIFIGANIFLGLLIIFNLIFKIFSAVRNKMAIKNENIYQGDSGSVQK